MIVKIEDSGAFNYYHFLIYCLGCVQSIPNRSNITKVYVPLYENTFILPILSILFPIAEIIDSNKNKITDNIDFISNGSETIDHLIFLRNTFLPFVGEKQEKYNRVYISRRKNSDSLGHKNICARHIYNENEMMEKLKELGFVEILLEDLNFYDHINIFYHADIILAAHGASLTNALFAGEKTNIIEILNEERPGRDCFKKICSALHIPHHKVNFLYNTDSEDNGNIDSNGIYHFLLETFGK